MKHYESSSIKLSKDILGFFFRKRTTERDNIYKIFGGVEGNEDMILEGKRYEKCTITFHFTNHNDMTGEVKKYLEYSANGGRDIFSYMKTMVNYLVNDRNMDDCGHFCVVVDF